MGNQHSSEASSEAAGVQCFHCRCALPRNNWSYVDLGEYGTVFLFYSVRDHAVTVSENINLGTEPKGSTPGMNVGFSEGTTMSGVKAMDYIRLKARKDGYVCVECFLKSCKAWTPGYDTFLREVNDLLRINGIKVESARLNAQC